MNSGYGGMAGRNMNKGSSRYYDFAAKNLLNVVLLFLAINLAAYLCLKGFKIADALTGKTNPIAEKYGGEMVSVIYPQMNRETADNLLKETWSRPLEFEPFTHFRERPYRGSYVNVDKNGFRITTNQGPWPPNPSSFNIFLFGGSTTFGYGVSDKETIASHLQGCLSKRVDSDVRVYNFGRGYYYSTQERILFEKLLSDGCIPDLAVFIDGLNEFLFPENEPYLTNRLREFHREGMKGTFSEQLVRMPLMRLIRHIRERGHRAPAVRDEKLSASTDTPVQVSQADAALARKAVHLYLANKKLIESAAHAFGTRTVFVWQPVPTPRSERSDGNPLPWGQMDNSLLSSGYETIDQLRRTEKLGPNFFWCADADRGVQGPLYVDKCHYSSPFSARIAERIADSLASANLLKDARAGAAARLTP